MRLLSQERKFSLRASLDTWQQYFLPTGLPLLIGLVLGPLLALLIVSENLVFALAILFIIPITILLNRYPFAAIIIWMAAMPWFPFRGVYRYLYFTVHRMLLPITVGLVILSRMLRIKDYPNVRPKPAELATLAFGVVGIISIFITRSDWKAIFTLGDRFLTPFAAYWLIRILNVKQQDLRRLLPLILILTLSECVIGLISWFAPNILPSIWHMRLFGSRVTGTFDGAGPYGYTLISFMVFLYHEAMNRRRGFVRTFLILTVGFGGICLFFTFTRAVWGASLFFILGLLYLYPKHTALLLASVVSIMLILPNSLFSDEVVYANERLNTTENTAQARLVLANAGKKMFYARPIFGWGYGNYDRYDWRFIERVAETTPTEWQIKQGTSHHTYLTILAEMGIFGFSLYILPILWCLVRTIKVLPQLTKEGFWSQRLLLAMWLPTGAQIIIGQTSDFRFALYALTLFWMTLGFIANMLQGDLCPCKSNV